MTDAGAKPVSTDAPVPTAVGAAPFAALNALGPAARPLAMLATFVLVLIAILAMHEVAGLVVPILFGLLLALVAAPLVGVFERRGLSHRMAEAATLGVVLGVMAISVILIAFSIAQFVAQLQQYQDKLTEALDDLRTALANAGVEVSSD